MNSLSIFLYLADVLGNFQGYMVFLTIALGFILGARAVYCMIEEMSFDYRWIALPIVMGVMACLIPSKNTIYLIAGSEAGEIVVTSQEGKAILNDIQLAIQNQLKELQQ